MNEHHVKSTDDGFKRIFMTDDEQISITNDDERMLITDNDDYDNTIEYIDNDLEVFFPNKHILPIIHIEPTNPTTMTIIIDLDGDINYPYILNMIQIRHIDRTRIYQHTKTGIPIIGEIGAIISARYCNEFRGYIGAKNSSQRSFKHTVSLYVSTGTNNLSVKLSKTIHMCGAKSSKIAIDIARKLINNIAQFTDLLKLDMRIKRSTFDWFVKRISFKTEYSFDHGMLTLIDRINLVKIHELTQHAKDLGCVTIDEFARKIDEVDCQCTNFDDYSYIFDSVAITKFSNCQERWLYRIPDLELSTEDVHVGLLDFMLNHALDLRWYYVEHLTAHIWYFLTQAPNPLSDPIPKPIKIRSEMVNVNYKLNFRIRLAALCQIIEATNINCRARYNPQYDRYLSIYFPCSNRSPKEIMKELESKNEVEMKNYTVRYCTLLVYETGCVTQSCPNEKLAKDVRSLFLRLIHKIGDAIRLS